MPIEAAAHSCGLVIVRGSAAEDIALQGGADAVAPNVADLTAKLEQLLNSSDARRDLSGRSHDWFARERVLTRESGHIALYARLRESLAVDESRTNAGGKALR